MTAFLLWSDSHYLPHCQARQRLFFSELQATISQISVFTVQKRTGVGNIGCNLPPGPIEKATRDSLPFRYLAGAIFQIGRLSRFTRYIRWRNRSVVADKKHDVG